jgi:hypothetical protein
LIDPPHDFFVQTNKEMKRSVTIDDIDMPCARHDGPQAQLQKARRQKHANQQGARHPPTALPSRRATFGSEIEVFAEEDTSP